MNAGRVVLVALCALGCASVPSGRAARIVGESTPEENTNAPPPEAPEQTELPSPAAGQGRWEGRTGTGLSPEDPVGTCGPGDAYAFVSGEFECPEGGNPLHGDPMAGAQSRMG